MARWGHFDISELKKLAKGLEQMQKELPAFIESCSNDAASMLLAKVVKRTPVGDYNGNWVEFTTSSGERVRFQTRYSRRGGTLRRGWTYGARRRTPTGYETDVINPVEYSLYVEHGHRTANHKGWVEGRFMLANSEAELKRELPSILARRAEQFIKKHLEG